MRKLSVLLIMVGVVFAGLPVSEIPAPQNETDYRLLGEITDEPAGGWISWWAGVGDLADFTVNNTTQGGYFGRKWDQYHSYDIVGFTNPDTAQYGNVGEYPSGSLQYYIYACGAWFGAEAPLEIDGSDTTWGPSVCKGAYRCDLGGMAVPEMTNTPMGDIHGIGLYFSNMIIPYDQGYNEEGLLLFTVPGKTALPHQIDWPFTDPAFGKPAGDWVSHEDTYMVGGDWIPEDYAAGVWLPYLPEGWTDSLDVYGLSPLGIRVEMRTYSWARGLLRNTVVLNYKIRNMNEHTLKNPYFSYFMDNDLGHGGSDPGDDGGWDDLIGYNAGNEVVYTYDENGSESGWSTAPGYIGVIFIETPGDVGAIGCESWDNDSANHMDSEHYGDDLKFDRMMATGANIYDTPSDVRMLLNSGPYPDMAPGEEYDFTLAVVMGDNMGDLNTNIDAVRAAFASNFPWTAVEEDEIVKGSPRLRLSSATVSAGEIEVRYSLPSAGYVDLAVFDATGRRVEVLKQGAAPAGESEVTWTASDASSGVYFIKLAAAGEIRTRRVLILK